MAYTTSSQIFTKEAVADLDVIPTYEELMVASVGPDSVYIRAKETIDKLLADGRITSPERANVLSSLLSNIVSSISGQAMALSYEIAKDRRDAPYQLTKAKEDTLLVKEQRNKIAADNVTSGENIDLIAEEVNLKRFSGWKVQADLVRDDGVNLPTVLETTLLPQGSIETNKGLKHYQEEQSKISGYATMAKSFRENGVVGYTANVDGSISSMSDLQPANPGLTQAQYDVAVRQVKAFDDNKFQHAANSSANMISMLISSGNGGAVSATDADLWRAAVTYLNTETA